MKIDQFWVLGFYLFQVVGDFTLQTQEVILKFDIIQDKKIYDQSAYGEAPQFAIWVLNIETQEVQNIYVTHKTATGDFIGRSGVPVTLPYWVGYMEKHKQMAGIPSHRTPLQNVDAISGPTPDCSNIVFEIEVPPGTKWGYYIEVNVAGDYTPEFPLYQSGGAMDSYGNGQPSIIYYGEIDATPGAKSTPELLGRTEQMYFNSTINNDLTGIVNAQDVFRDIQVTCTTIQK